MRGASLGLEVMPPLWGHQWEGREPWLELEPVAGAVSVGQAHRWGPGPWGQWHLAGVVLVAGDLWVAGSLCAGPR